MFTVAQLSTSNTDKQPSSARSLALAMVALLITYGTPAWSQGSMWQQPSDVEIRIEPLSSIDQQFMREQRARIEVLSNRLGRRLTGSPDRDLETLQMILDKHLVARDDRLTLQAMGIVLGDLLSRPLRMNWVVYRDRAGRSRALSYRDQSIYLFPVTMIARRFEAGNTCSIADIYQRVLNDTRQQLPGARWLQDSSD